MEVSDIKAVDKRIYAKNIIIKNKSIDLSDGSNHCKNGEDLVKKIESVLDGEYYTFGIRDFVEISTAYLDIFDNIEIVFNGTISTLAELYRLAIMTNIFKYSSLIYICTFHKYDICIRDPYDEIDVNTGNARTTFSIEMALVEEINRAYKDRLIFKALNNDIDSKFCFDGKDQNTHHILRDLKRFYRVTQSPNLKYLYFTIKNSKNSVVIKTRSLEFFNSVEIDDGENTRIIYEPCRNSLDIGMDNIKGYVKNYICTIGKYDIYFDVDTDPLDNKDKIFSLVLEFYDPYDVIYPKLFKQLNITDKEELH